MLHVGLDVQVRRRCPFFVMSDDGEHVESGWLPPDGAPAALRTLVDHLHARHRTDIAVGIDAPRQPLPSPRRWGWGSGRWDAIGLTAKGHGRHCEVVVSALGLANPQWTPVAESARPWMQLGFALFAALDGLTHVYEVFPSASYTQLANDPRADPSAITISFATFRPGPKDMLDAALAAFTVREFVAGRGAEVGGGDGLGTIVLPRPIATTRPAVHSWPTT